MREHVGIAKIFVGQCRNIAEQRDAAERTDFAILHENYRFRVDSHGTVKSIGCLYDLMADMATAGGENNGYQE